MPFNVKHFKAKDNTSYKRKSRWIQIRYRPVTDRHSLYDYADGDILTYFVHKGKEYALGQFMRMIPPIEISDGDETVMLCGYDCTDYWYPYLLEINDTGEAVRLYIRERED